MTFKRTKFDESPVMRSFEKVAMEKGLIEPDPVVKEASAGESYEPTDDLFNDMVRLANGLREKGFVAEAIVLENKIFEHKRAAKEAKDEGEKMLDEAHPEGDVEVAPSKGGYGKMLTQKTTQDEIKKIVNKKPTGKYAYKKAQDSLKDPGSAASAMAGTFGIFLEQYFEDYDAGDIGDAAEGYLKNAIETDVGLNRIDVSQLPTVIKIFRDELKANSVDWADHIKSGPINDQAFALVCADIYSKSFPKPLQEGESGYCMDAAAVVEHIVKATEDALGVTKKAWVDPAGEDMPIIRERSQKLVDEIDGILRAKSSDYTIDPYLEAGGLSGEEVLRELFDNALLMLFGHSKSDATTSDFATMADEYDKMVKVKVGDLLSGGDFDLAMSKSDEDDDVVVANVIANAVAGYGQKIKMKYWKTNPDAPKYLLAFNNIQILISTLSNYISSNKGAKELSEEKKALLEAADTELDAMIGLKHEIRVAYKKASKDYQYSYRSFLSQISKYSALKGWAEVVPSIDKLVRIIPIRDGEWQKAISTTASSAEDGIHKLADELTTLRREQRMLSAKKDRSATDNARLAWVTRRIAELQAAPGSDEPAGSGLPPVAPGKPKPKGEDKPKPPVAPSGGYVPSSSPIREMQTALRDLGNLVKPKQPQRAAVLMGGGVDGNWKGGTDTAIAEAEKLRGEMKVEVGTPLVSRAGIPYAHLSYTARANTVTLKKMIESYSKGGGLPYTASEGKSYGKYKTPEDNDVEIFSGDVRSLRSFLKFMERTGVIHEVRGPAPAPPRPRGEGSAYTAEEEEVFPSPEETGKVHSPGAPGGPKLMPEAGRKYELSKLAQIVDPWAKDEPKPKDEKPKSTGPRGIGLTYGEWDRILKHFKDEAAHSYWDESVEDKLGPRRLYNKMLYLERQLGGLKQSEQEAPDALSDKVVDLDKSKAPGIPGAGLPYVPGLKPGHALVENQRGDKAQWNTSDGPPPSGWSYVYGPGGGQPGAPGAAGAGYGGYGQIQGPPISHGVLDLRRHEFRMPPDFRKPLYWNEFYYSDDPAEFMGTFFGNVKPKNKKDAELLFAIQRGIKYLGWSKKAGSLIVEKKDEKGKTETVTLRAWNPPGYEDHMRLHTGGQRQQALKFVRLARARLSEVFNRWMSTLPYDPAELSRALKPVQRAVRHWTNAFNEKEVQLRGGRI